MCEPCGCRREPTPLLVWVSVEWPPVSPPLPANCHHPPSPYSRAPDESWVKTAHDWEQTPESQAPPALAAGAREPAWPHPGSGSVLIQWDGVTWSREEEGSPSLESTQLPMGGSLTQNFVVWGGRNTRLGTDYKVWGALPQHSCQQPAEEGL